MLSHPTRLAGDSLSNPAFSINTLLIKAHLIYQAKFLSLVDLVGVVYTFPKIMAVSFGHKEDNQQGRKFQNSSPISYFYL